MSTLLVLGAGGHGRVVADAAVASERWLSVIFRDDRFPELSRSGAWSVEGTVDDALVTDASGASLVVAIGNSETRLGLLRRLRHRGAAIASVAHPHSSVSPHAVLGAGTVVLAGAVVAIGVTLGDGVIINHGAVVDHDCRLGDGVHVCPGATVAGGVTIGRGCWIGAGASIRDGVTIGDGVVVGAGAAVVSDQPDHVAVVGVPARPCRS